MGTLHLGNNVTLTSEATLLEMYPNADLSKAEPLTELENGDFHSSENCIVYPDKDTGVFMQIAKLELE